MDITDYTIDEHIHRFAVWTAARAASRSRLKNTEVEYLINSSNLKQGITLLRENKSLDDITYRKWFKEHCEKICELVTTQDLLPSKTAYFCTGLAAKIISIYIKTVEIIPTKGASLLSKVAYPPIDSILLNNLNLKHGTKLKINWSRFNWEDLEIRLNLLNDWYPAEPKWKIEVEWKVSNEEDENSSETSVQKR